jgi:hypothetical protein
MQIRRIREQQESERRIGCRRLAEFERHVGDLRALAPEVVLDMLALRREDACRVLAFTGIAERAVVASGGVVYRAYGRMWRTEPGSPDPLPLTEESPLRERLSPDGLDYDKISVEAELRAPGELPVTILCLPAVHRPGDRLQRFWTYT